MNLRTTFTIDPSESKIGYNTPVMFIGSCFASEIGTKLTEGGMKVLINPAGVVYNPVSVGNTLDIILENKIFNPDDLYIYKGINLSFSHYTEFSSESQEKVLEKINTSTFEANLFLKKARFLFITLGTARVYRFSKTNKIVSNCHKLPASLFSEEILTVEEIVLSWGSLLHRIKSFNNELQIIFSISPVRHWKDGAHGNQVSKSVLFLAVEKLMESNPGMGYFPAYELLMDDLRDYRYYAEDMLHPSPTAVDYIWNSFSNCYFNTETTALWQEVQSITKAMNHRFLTDSIEGRREFGNRLLEKIDILANKHPYIDFSRAKKYFLALTV